MKVGRNDPCSCGSGKKFKKCCENPNLSKKINATLVSHESALVDVSTTTKVTVNFFKNKTKSDSHSINLSQKEIKHKI